VQKTPLPAKRLHDALLKNKVTQLPPVASVVLRVNSTEVRVFNKPEVYSSDGTYLVFGVPLEDEDAGEPPS
jgi:NACalpha-BTF3-like transcription factor